MAGPRRPSRSATSKSSRPRDRVSGRDAPRNGPGRHKTSRLIDRLNAPWYAFYIQTPSEDITRIDAATHRLLYKNLELARQLGGTTIQFKDRDVPSTILAFAQEYGIKVIVVGKSRRPWHRRILDGSITDRSTRESIGIDIVVVDD